MGRPTLFKKGPMTPAERQRRQRRKRARLRQGRQPHDLVTTLVQGKNADLIHVVSNLYLRRGDAVLDLTYGRGVFWRYVDLTLYAFDYIDINPAMMPPHRGDFHAVDRPSASFDVVVFDPPYMHNPGQPIVNDRYRNAETHGAARRALELVDEQEFTVTHVGNSDEAGPIEFTLPTARKTDELHWFPHVGKPTEPAPQTRTTTGHDGIMADYAAGMAEGLRLLKPGGFLWVKTQDEIESGRQKWSHIEIHGIAAELGLVAKDLFVLAPKQTTPLRYRQLHAKKAHSYLWVFRKPTSHSVKIRHAVGFEGN